MLKKLFSPEVQDICPNCGKMCATTDVLCPNCGKNLDELFEQLSDSDVSFFAPPRWMMSPMKARTSSIWRVINSIILIIAFLAPWEIVYSDILPSEPFTINGLRVFFISISIDLAYIFFLDCLYCISVGLTAIGYLSLIIYTLLNFIQANLKKDKPYQRLRKALGVCVIVSALMLLRIVTPMMLTAIAWGYWVACVGLLLSLCLEARERISSKSFVDNSLPEAA